MSEKSTSLNLKSRRNILYSTSRQWNPGDEFILCGAINIMTEILGQHNTFIYNRNPDVRSTEVINLKSRFGLVFNDNSLKPNTNCSFIDLVVFAGTPEWCNDVCQNLYEQIIRYNLPTIFIGIGSNSKHLSPAVKEVLSKSLYFSFRDAKFQTVDSAQNYLPKTVYKPCPAMQCVKLGGEKRISSVKAVGLVYAVNLQKSVVNNCVSDDVYIFIKRLYTGLINKYGHKYKFYILCHYIDEVSDAHSTFTDNEVLYSFDSAGYASIYSNCDLIISPRVHGCGLASSLGIPSISVQHDIRGTTTEGFLSYPIGKEMALEDVFSAFEQITKEIAAINSKLILHKKESFESYVNEISNVISLNRINYDKSILQYPYLKNENDLLFKNIHVFKMFFYIAISLFTRGRKKKRFARKLREQFYK